MSADEKIICPVCGWEHEREVVKYAESNKQAAPGIAQAMGLPTDALLSIHLSQAMKRDEQAIKNHLNTHPPEDWLPVLMDYKRLSEERESTLREANWRDY